MLIAIPKVTTNKITKIYTEKEKGIKMVLAKTQLNKNCNNRGIRE